MNSTESRQLKNHLEVARSELSLALDLFARAKSEQLNDQTQWAKVVITEAIARAPELSLSQGTCNALATEIIIALTRARLIVIERPEL